MTEFGRLIGITQSGIPLALCLKRKNDGRKRRRKKPPKEKKPTKAPEWAERAPAGRRARPPVVEGRRSIGDLLRSLLLLLSLRGLALLDLWPLLRTLAELALSGLTGFFLRGHRAKGGQD